MKTAEIISIPISLLLLFSCSRFLTEKPSTSLLETYDTEYALEGHERGIIKGLEGKGMFVSDMLSYLQYASCLVHWGTTTGRTNNETWTCTIDHLNISETSNNLTMYSSFYTAIGRCNNLISGVENSHVDKVYRTEIASEAKLYRAFLYFNLVRLYGNVPLVLEPFHTASDYRAIPRTDYNEIYVQIVKDLEDAFTGMRDPARVEAITPGQGRPNKWAAKALLSCVYLQMASILSVPSDENFYNPSLPGRIPDFSKAGISTEDDAWGKAYETAKDVIQNGPYRLAANFGDLFRWSYEFTDKYGKNSWNLDERILMIQSTGNNTANYSATRSLMQYPEGAIVPAGTTTAQQGEVRPNRFFFSKWCELTDGEKALLGTSTDSIYVNTPDPRMSYSLFHTKFIQCSDSTNVKIYPTEANNSSTNKLRSMPYYKKYLSPTYAGVPDKADLYLLRLAEIYYVAAEAAIRLNKSSEAYSFVEAVHSRARLSDPSGIESSSPKWAEGKFANADDFVTALIWDKLFELCGEGHEFYETRRLGARWFCENIVIPANGFLKLEYQEGSYIEQYYRAGFQFPTDIQKLRGSLLCEFPVEELSLNTSLSLKDRNDYSWMK